MQRNHMDCIGSACCRFRTTPLHWYNSNPIRTKESIYAFFKEEDEIIVECLSTLTTKLSKQKGVKL